MMSAMPSRRQQPRGPPSERPGSKGEGAATTWNRVTRRRKLVACRFGFPPVSVMAGL